VRDVRRRSPPSLDIGGGSTQRDDKKSGALDALPAGFAMGIKPAQQAFTKDDIIDILKRNVTLYKNEAEFVEYIVNLSLYLIDQAYVLGGVRSGDLESVLERYERSLEAMPAPAAMPMPAPLGPPAARVEIPADAFAEENERPTNKIRLQQFEGVFKAPPPVGGDLPTPKPLGGSPRDQMPPTGPLSAQDDDELDPSTGQIRAAQLAEAITMTPPPDDSAPPIRIDNRVPLSARKPATPKAEAPPSPPSPQRPPEGPDPEEPDYNGPKTRQLRSPAQLTPFPSGGLTDRSPQIEVGNSGKTRVYKMVRSYNVAKGKESVCPICGTDTKGSNLCPSCGHIL
jgi:hypothetical protein